MADMGFCKQARLDKEDLRIELSVAALRKQSKRAAQKAADLEMSQGEHAAGSYLRCRVGWPTTIKSWHSKLASTAAIISTLPSASAEYLAQVLREHYKHICTHSTCCCRH